MRFIEILSAVNGKFGLLGGLFILVYVWYGFFTVLEPKSLDELKVTQGRVTGYSSTCPPRMENVTIFCNFLRIKMKDWICFYAAI